MRIHAPSERNRRLAAFLEAANADTQLKARWHVAQVTAERLGHERPLVGPPADRAQPRAAAVPAAAPRRRAVGDRDATTAMNADDAEVVIAGGCLLHDLGMSIHRVDHEAFSLFLAADLLDGLLGRGLRGARADDHRLRDPARDHRPPQRRAPAHARGRRRARRRRARHGARPLARRRSRRACRTSTRCRRPRSTRSGSSPARQRASASRSR